MEPAFDFSRLIPLLIPIVLVQFGLQIYCLVDLARQPAVVEERWGWPISDWPKWGRALLILLFQIPGVLVYLFLGRKNE
jgi:hypothetical protein